MKHRLPRTQASDASELSRRVYDLERRMDPNDTGVDATPPQVAAAGPPEAYAFSDSLSLTAGQGVSAWEELSDFTMDSNSSPAGAMDASGGEINFITGGTYLLAGSVRGYGTAVTHGYIIALVDGYETSLPIPDFLGSGGNWAFNVPIVPLFYVASAGSTLFVGVANDSDQSVEVFISPILLRVNV